VGPAIAAISLGLVGRRAMSTRTGRNFRYNAAGNALTAAAMGLLGSYLATRAIFLSAAALCVPALIALSRVRSSEIDYDRARNAGSGEHAKKLQRVIELAKNRPLLVFGACTLLFQLADASMLPLIGEELAQSKGALGSISMSGLIIVPAVLVALLAPWVGYHSERWGRKPLLLLGFGFEILRAILFAFVSGLPSLILVQVLGGISSAMVTVLTILVLTDVTTGTGRFNLARGAIGTLMGIAAAVSTTATGFLFQQFGHEAGFLALAAVAAAATALLWLFLPETKPAEYLD